MWTWVTIYSVTVCLGSCSLSVQFLQSSVTMFTITRHHPFHLTTFMVSVTDLETLTYPSPHAVHQHELNKWYEFKSNEAIWGYGQFFSVSISSKVSSLEPRSPVWKSIHFQLNISKTKFSKIFPKTDICSNKFYQMFRKLTFAVTNFTNFPKTDICSNKFYQLHLGPPKYWDFQIVFSIWQMQQLGYSAYPAI